ncbi:MAG: hypothetical protein E7627_00340 [Ruminococcaceae bacterium]|nr:hypothetical protein [Oscillospiraceae bacterium]
MDVNKRFFLDFLLGTGDVHVLFEPYFSHGNAETIIWRRGDHLWDSPKEYIKTMLSVAERTQSDVMVCDVGLFRGDKKLMLIEYLRKYMLKGRPIGTCVICHSQEDVDMASDIADCLGVYGNAKSKIAPVIRMDGTIEEAIARGDSGWFARDNVEHYLKNYGDKIRILGGLGAEFIQSASPAKIQKSIERLAAKYKGKWAVGSGGIVSKDKYLELASMLWAFLKLR